MADLSNGSGDGEVAAAGTPRGGKALGQAFFVALGVAVFLAVVFVGGPSSGGGAAHPGSPVPAAAEDDEEDLVPEGSYAVPPPPFQTEEVRDSLEETGKPCSGCHDEDWETNPEPRALEAAHESILLKHDEKHRWCLSCHDARNRDMLRLAGGTLVDFKESYRLCGQCHGDKYRDWRLGIHGRRVGAWNGKKEYLLCVHCHWAHAPAIPPRAPQPAPRRPEAIR